MSHGDAHGVIAPRNGGGGEPLALGAEQQRQLRERAAGGLALGQARVQLVGGHGFFGERHGGAGEAVLVQLSDALIAPGAAAGAVRYVCVADAGPRHLENRAHGNAHGPAVQRVVAGGAREYGVYSEGGRAAEDGPHVRVVRDVLQHRYQARIAQHVGNGRKRGASEGPQGAARQLEAGEPLELVMGRHEHRQPLAAGLLARALFHSLDKRRHGG